MNAENDIEKALKKVKWEIPGELDRKVLADGFAAMDQAFAGSEAGATGHAATVLERPEARKSERRSRHWLSALPRWAIPIASPVVILIVIGLIYCIGGSGVAFADVLDHVRSARTLTYNVTVQLDGQPAITVPVMMMEPGKTRQMMPGGGIMIMDIVQGKSLVLDPNEKKAILMQMTGQPQMPDQMSGGFIEGLRSLAAGSEERLGKQEIDGQDAVGFEVDMAGWNWTIWADAQTGIPIRIEMEGGMFGGATVTMTDFKLDVDLDESLFSLTQPEGYTLEEMQVDASAPTEKDLIEGLRFMTEMMDGTFPSEFTASGMSEVDKTIERNLPSDLEEREAALKPLVMKIVRAFLFVHMMTADKDWHYAGKGVKLGDANTPVCWWLPEGSDTYRVIYGDLSVRDVDASDLP